MIVVSLSKKAYRSLPPLLMAGCSLFLGCSDSTEPAGTPSVAGTGGNAGDASAGGLSAIIAAGTGGTVPAGQAGQSGGVEGGAPSNQGGSSASAGTATASGGLGGAAGGLGGHAGSSGSAGSAGAGGNFPDPSTLKCNAVLGVSVTGDWFNAGFETGLDGSKWQLKWRSLGFVEQWADPSNDIWSRPWDSPCANGSDDPERVIFTGVNWTFKTEAEWETQLDAVVVTLKAKYPSLKEIDLMTMLRAPGNVVCPGATTVEQVVAPYIDEAIAAIVLKYPKLVRAAPAFYAPSCDVFLPNSPHFAAGQAAVVAKIIRDYYVSH